LLGRSRPRRAVDLARWPAAAAVPPWVLATLHATAACRGSRVAAQSLNHVALPSLWRACAASPRAWAPAAVPHAPCHRLSQWAFPLLRALSPCRGPAVPFCLLAATVFQFTSSKASSSSLPADRPHCASSLAPPCSNWSFSAPPGLKAELGHASWQPTPFPLNSRLIAQLASPPPPPHPTRHRGVLTTLSSLLTRPRHRGAPPLSRVTRGRPILAISRFPLSLRRGCRYATVAPQPFCFVLLTLGSPECPRRRCRSAAIVGRLRWSAPGPLFTAYRLGLANW
jgi:hypothetical protein